MTTTIRTATAGLTSAVRSGNDTHQSKTDPDSRLMRKGRGKEAKLSFGLNVLSENRNGLIVGVNAMIASGHAERNGAIELLDESTVPMSARPTLGADKGYDARTFFEALTERGFRPHIAIQHTNRKKRLLDRRTTNSRAYKLSQIFRRKVEGVLDGSNTRVD